MYAAVASGYAVAPKRAQLGKERKQVLNLVGGFDHEHCEAWTALNRLFGTGVRHKEWYSFGMVIAHHMNIARPSRTARRSVPALILWFQQNWPHIEPQIQTFHFLDEDGQRIDKEREIRETGSGWSCGPDDASPF
jgi:hypothetical protein